MTWRVVIHRSVRKFERRHPEYKGVITRAVSELAEGPYIGTRLKGRCNWLWRLRKGNLRIIYEIRASSKTVYVWRVVSGRIFTRRSASTRSSAAYPPYTAGRISSSRGYR